MCTWVADIRGGNKDENSSVRLDHLFTSSGGTDLLRTVPPSAGGTTRPLRMHLGHTYYHTVIHIQSNQSIYYSSESPDSELRLRTPSPECHSIRRCNRLRCPLARMSGLQCFNMGHNGHGINMYGVSMILMGN